MSEFSFNIRHFTYVAERVGFEPTEALTSTVFKTAAIDHSATSPLPGVIAVRGGLWKPTMQ